MVRSGVRKMESDWGFAHHRVNDRYPNFPSQKTEKE